VVLLVINVPRMTWFVGTNGRERSHETFWAAESRKSGVAPARFGSFPAVAFEIPVLHVSVLREVQDGEGEVWGEDGGEERNSYILHREAMVLGQPNAA
jgi:hypothetical protein